MFKLGVIGLAVVTTIVLAGYARADTVAYSVDGVGAMQFPGPITPPNDAPWGANGYPGDTVAIAGYTGAIDLTPGSSIQQIGAVNWTVNYTYAGTATDPNSWSNLTFNFNATSNISIDGSVVGSLSQPGQLNVQWDNDYLSFSSGSTTSFLADGYAVQVTPLAISETGAWNWNGVAGDGNPPWPQTPSLELMAEFDVTSLPDGGGPGTEAGDTAVPAPSVAWGVMIPLSIYGCFKGLMRRRTSAPSLIN